MFSILIADIVSGRLVLSGPMRGLLPIKGCVSVVSSMGTLGPGSASGYRGGRLTWDGWLNAGRLSSVEGKLGW